MDGQDLIKDEFGPTDESGKRLTTWYAQGHSDALGDRLLMFDNTSAPSWEILRFKPDLAADARFETELRHRVDQLSSFRHPSFPAVRPITELDLDEDLAVVSTYASGVSLSDGLKKPRSAMFAVRLLRQLVPAVAALQQHGPGISHGAITLERLVLTAEGRLMVREHMRASIPRFSGARASTFLSEGAEARLRVAPFQLAKPRGEERQCEHGQQRARRHQKTGVFDSVNPVVADRPLVQHREMPHPQGGGVKRERDERSAECREQIADNAK